jgi:hypothetical protein
MRDTEKQIFACASDVNANADAIRRLLFQDANADYLIGVAIREGLAGFLYRTLLKAGMLEALQPQQRATLETAYYQTVRSNLKLIHAVKEVLYAVNARQIRLVLVQGMDLLHTVYEDIGVRPMTDVDLWMRKEDFLTVIAVFGQLGYSRDSIYPTTFRRDSATFDLHTHLLWANRIKARKRLLNIDEESILAKTRPVLVEGVEALCLNPYDQFIYLGLHALKHRANRLMWMVDLKSLAGHWRESEWKELAGRARELGQEKTISYMLFMLRHLFAFRASVKAQALPRLSHLEKKVLRQRIQGEALPPWGPAFLFSSGKGLVKGFPIFLESLFPRPEILKQIFPECSEQKTSRLYLKRAIQLLGMLRRG